MPRRGSGSKPYATTVDLTGPAFRCSCPSCSFPCKHALSLLTLWASGALPAGSEPEFASEWLLTLGANHHSRRRDRRHPGPRRVIDEDARSQHTTTARRTRRGGARRSRTLAHRPGPADSGRSPTTTAPTTRRPYAPSSLTRRHPASPRCCARAPPGMATSARIIRAYRDVASLPDPLARSVHTHLGFPTKADSRPA